MRNRLADQLVGGPAEHRFDRTIGKDERPLRSGRNDALRGGLEQRPQRTIVFLVAPRLEGFLGPAALGDVELEAGQPRDLAGLIAFGASQALHPSHLTIRERDAVCVIPRILESQDLLECARHPRTVFDVHTRQPGVE